jgi:hypothetical protein
MTPIEVGGYKVVLCRSCTTGNYFYQVNQDGALDPISQHGTRAAAIAAAKRYTASDKRRALPQE